MSKEIAATVGGVRFAWLLALLAVFVVIAGYSKLYDVEWVRDAEASSVYDELSMSDGFDEVNATTAVDDDVGSSRVTSDLNSDRNEASLNVQEAAETLSTNDEFGNSWDTRDATVERTWGVSEVEVPWTSAISAGADISGFDLDAPVSVKIGSFRIDCVNNTPTANLIAHQLLGVAGNHRYQFVVKDGWGISTLGNLAVLSDTYAAPIRIGSVASLSVWTKPYEDLLGPRGASFEASARSAPINLVWAANGASSLSYYKA